MSSTINDHLLSILHVNRSDRRGGAAQVAWNLFSTYRQSGYTSWMAVEIKLTDEQDVFTFPEENARTGWYQFWMDIQRYARKANQRLPGLWRLGKAAGIVAAPFQSFNYYLGRENFYYPGTQSLFSLLPKVPDVIHCHVLHGGYFDLRQLVTWSLHFPVFLTLHDAWLLSGHCAHSFECNRWQYGCGSCPDLSIPPAIKRDATAYNWRQKRDIYRRSRLYVATPCQWLMDKVRKSMLMEGIAECKVIPCGIDHSIFHPADRLTARLALGLPMDVRIVLFSANGIRRNIWKDYATLREAIVKTTNNINGKLIFLALGESAETERIGHSEIHFIPHESDPRIVSQYYQAADVYTHGARIDTFPNAILEALSCGIPVVATAVGGIPEQVKGWHRNSLTDSLNPYPLEEATGILVPQGDSEAMASAVVDLLSNNNHRTKLATNAACDARKRFSLNNQAQIYLDWYQEVLERDAEFFKH